MRIRLSILILMSTTFCCWTSTYSDDFDHQLKQAKDSLEDANFDGVIGLYINQQYLFWEFGAARNNPTPPEDTQVDINSITKTVTAAMVLHLVSTGKLELTTTVGEVFPEIPDDKKAITVHQLLTHTSGLRSSVGTDPEKLKKEDFLKRVARKKLRSEPGETFHYSNVGYSVLAAILEERSGLSYEEYLHTFINDVAALKSSGYDTVFDPKKGLRSRRGHDIKKVSWGGHPPYWNLIGNGGLISTPKEFLHFLQAWRAGSFGGVESFNQAIIRQTPEPAAGRYYGYGFTVQDSAHFGQSYWHDGGNNIYTALWRMYENDDRIYFTAATDNKHSDAFKAMRILITHLEPSIKPNN